MKKVLIATTALVATAGMAAADIANFRVGGTGRVGLVYIEDRGPGLNDTQVNMRLRFNFDVAKQLDNGVTVGGRIRMQYDQGRTQDDSGEGGAEINAAYLYAESGGIRVEVGNANTAFDSLGLLYNAEVGFVSSTVAGYAQATYTGYQTNPYAPAQANRMGLFAQYKVGDLVARVSYVTPDQTVSTLPVGVEDEFGFSIDYKTGPFKFGFGAAFNGNFIDGNDVYALLGEYAINDSTNIGLQWVRNGDTNLSPVIDNSSDTITLYANTKLANGIGIQGYIGANDDVGTEDIALGIGFTYDLGGATLAGSIQRGFNDETYADLGVRFSW